MIFTRRTIPNATAALWRTVYSLFAKDELVVASDEVRAGRVALCQDCRHNRQGQCELCTCYIGLKTLLANERCPAKIWGPQTKRSTGLT
jgi:hypothetical protein